MSEKNEYSACWVVACARILRIAGGASTLCASVFPAVSRADTMELEAFVDLAHRCGSTVAASTLAAVAKTESGFETLTVSDNTTHKSQIYQSLEEGASATERLIANGHSVDIGLMQINSANLKGLGMTVRDALDPCKSIAGGASILMRNYLGARDAPTQQMALRDAISQYNTGNRTDGYRNGYVQKVEQAASKLLVTDLTGIGGPGEDIGIESWDVWASEENQPAQDPAITKSSSIEIF